MHHSVDRGRCGHHVFEDLLPLREHQIRGDHHAAPLVTLGQQRKQHLHLREVMLDVADVVENETLNAVEPGQLPGQTQLAFRLEQPFHQRVGLEFAGHAATGSWTRPLQWGRQRTAPS
jgi:hypothetical protein